jgi:hypothetical protein
MNWERLPGRVTLQVYTNGLEVCRQGLAGSKAAADQ